MATKATAKKAKATEDSAYSKNKLAVHGKLKAGATYTYRGRVKALDEKRVKLDGFEGRGGVHVKLGDKAFTVSPFALLGNGVERPGSKKAKTDKPVAKAKAKAAAKPTNGNGKANGHTK